MSAVGVRLAIKREPHFDIGEIHDPRLVHNKAQHLCDTELKLFTNTDLIKDRST